MSFSTTVVSSGSPTLQSVTVSLSTAQILTLNTNPVTLVSAPGVGKFIQFYDALFYLTYGGTPFDATGKILQIFYGGSVGGGQTLADDEYGGGGASTALSQTSSGAVVSIFSEGNLGYTLPVYAYALNQPLVLTLSTGNLTTGNSTLKVKVRYEVRPTTL